MSEINGQCLCGKITYCADEIGSSMGNCHCKMCRKFHGSAYATYAKVKREELHWLSGKDALKFYIVENGTMRKFCDNCGSSLVFQDDETETTKYVFLAAGTFDSDIDIKPDAHIYMESRANWFKPEDDLPKFETDRSSRRFG